MKKCKRFYLFLFVRISLANTLSFHKITSRKEEKFMKDGRKHDEFFEAKVDNLVGVGSYFSAFGFNNPSSNYVFIKTENSDKYRY